MARRKQRKPKHLENAEELATSLQNGIGSDSETEGDEHVCGKCRAEFPTLSDFLLHKKICVSKRPVLVAPLESVVDTDEEDNSDDMEDGFTPPPPQLESPRFDPPLVKEWLLENNKSIQSLVTSHMPGTNVTLQGLENTSVAVAQHSHMEELLIQGLFNVFSRNQQESLKLFKEWTKQILATHPLNAPTLTGTPALTPPQPNENGDRLEASAAPNTPLILEPYPTDGRSQHNLSMANLSLEGPPETTNSLALLEKQADRYIQDSMARRSFLLNGIDEDNKSKKGKDQDPASRHKCHFCGKLLGSDSALQIHVRSHTGEKPFQCNVCGSAFSTRGNLKVHCQRHKERMELPGGFITTEQKQSDERASADATTDNPSLFYEDDNNRGDSSKVEQALDFSTPVNGRKSPQPDVNSRSVSPNDTSNFSENSVDGSSDDNVPDDTYSDLKIDVERFDEEDRDTSNGLDDDGSEMASHPSFGSPNFAPYFLSPYDFPVTSTPATTGSNAVSNSLNNSKTTNNENSDAILQDPSYYQDLLPKIGSNDNSWESLIEITKTSETSKLQQLVDNIEHKLIEPNQCIICNRVLSCKSALQMHYRTHTGERPFRCKLCNRSFTTKGNLKTHMGVHRQKPVTRLMHQCPVCHNQYPNAIVLQQHIRTHTTDHVVPLPPVYHPIDDRPQTLLPPSYPRQFLIQSHLVSSEPLALTNSKTQEEPKKISPGESVIKPTGLENVTRTSSMSPPLSAGSSSPASNIGENCEEKESKPPILNLSQNDRPISPNDEVSSIEDTRRMSSDDINQDKDDKGENIPMDLKSIVQSSPEKENTPVQAANNNGESGRPSGSSPIQNEKLSPKFTSQPNTPLLVTLASDRPLPMTLPNDCPISFTVHGADRHYPPISIPNCTADYTTASLAALENHVKGINSSVTHPLPFAPHFGLGINMAGYFRDYNYPQKSTASSPVVSKSNTDTPCDGRATPVVASNGKNDSPRSSTSNSQALMKPDNGGGALDLTPRSSPAFQRPTASDLKIFPPLAGLPFGPPHHRAGTTCRVCYKTFACNSALEIHYRSHTKERPFRCEVCDRGFSTKGNMRQHMLTHKIRDFPPQAFSTNSNSNSSTNTSSIVKEASGEKSPKKAEESNKRPATDIALPPTPAKRAPGTPKHLCEVCHKPFSSGSALQIHMRTHTGDKPFQCHICHRAFTTKGNLKVHMGTHMWNNSTSRRGRRMSLDLGPLQLTPGAKPGEFAQPPYFPYINPFMNGLPTHPPPPPKMNEISVIQTAGMSNGNNSSTQIPVSSSASSQQPLPLLTSSNKQLDRNEGGLHQNQNQNHTQGKDIHPLMHSSQEIPASWPWKISCNICNKICSSSTELELHIRNNHCSKKESSDTERTD